MISKIFKLCILACSLITVSGGVKHKAERIANKQKLIATQVAQSKANENDRSKPIEQKTLTLLERKANEKAQTSERNLQNKDKEALKSGSYSWIVIRMSAETNQLYRYEKSGETGKAHVLELKKFLAGTYPYVSHGPIIKTLELLRFNRVPTGDYLLETDGSLTAIAVSKPFNLHDKIIVSIYENKALLFKGDILINSANRVTTQNPENWLWLYEHHFKQH